MHQWHMPQQSPIRLIAYQAVPGEILRYTQDDRHGDGCLPLLLFTPAFVLRCRRLKAFAEDGSMATLYAGQDDRHRFEAIGTQTEHFF